MKIILSIDNVEYQFPNFLHYEPLISSEYFTKVGSTRVIMDHLFYVKEKFWGNLKPTLYWCIVGKTDEESCTIVRQYLLNKIGKND